MLNAINDLVLNEVNIKSMKLVDSSDGVFAKRVKPDFKKLGPKFGKQMKAVAAAITQMSNPDIAVLESQGFVNLSIDGADARIDLADVEVISEDIPGWLVANEGSVTIAIDITLTPELKQEGIARDIVNRIQNIRKSRGYEITDRISLVFAPNAESDEAITRYKDYIGGQVLATSVSINELDGDDLVEQLDIDGLKINVKIALA
jgi:isoleucyl-tRNA synthetase